MDSGTWQSYQYQLYKNRVITLFVHHSHSHSNSNSNSKLRLETMSDPEDQRTSCPVKHGAKSHPMMGSKADGSKLPSKCPVTHKTAGGDDSSDSDSVPAVGDYFPDAKRHPEQLKPLSTEPVHSIIPKGGDEPDSETWVFPSPQRYYNAMKKKGWNPQEEEVPYIVSIHNAINEKCWQGVMKYEKFHSKYVSFNSADTVHLLN